MIRLSLTLALLASPALALQQHPNPFPPDAAARVANTLEAQRKEMQDTAAKMRAAAQTTTTETNK